jgi:Uma2 family endonuclease
MRTPLLVSEHEYLTSTYQPDREYDDGELQERNLGERPHSILQGEFSGYFRDLRKRGPVVRAFVEQRIRIAPRKYRIPDVCVYKEPAPREGIFDTPPFIAIEILSPDDTMSRVRKKIDEYLACGVAYVWLIDPYRRRADVYTGSQIYAPADLILRTEDPTIEVPLAELFHAIDE